MPYDVTYTYTVTVSDGINSETVSVAFYVEDCLGLGETSLNGVAVYPNPASSLINIVGISDYQTLKVMVVNPQGQVVKRISNSLEINVEDVEAGIYFINIECDGQQTMKKVVVE
jgi:hypothetical protein